MNSSLQEMDRAQWRASLMAKAIEIAGTASGTPDNRTLVAMFDDELEAFAGFVMDASGRVDAGYRQGWEDVRDALGLRGNLPVSNAQYHASVLMPKLREVIRAATPVPVESLGRDAPETKTQEEHAQDARAMLEAWRGAGLIPQTVVADAIFVSIWIESRRRLGQLAGTAPDELEDVDDISWPR